jgi:glycosyltransferase involved in cell wall biosynthesis
VISKFDGSNPAQLSALHPRLIPIAIADPPKTFMNLMVRLKRRLSRSLGNTEPNEQSPTVAPGGDGTPSTRKLSVSRIRELFFRVVMFLDEHKQWSWRASRAAERLHHAATPAAIVASGPPMSLLIGAARAARKRGIPLIVDLRDPWTGYPGEYVPRLSAALEARTLRSAAAIVCTSPGLAAVLIERGPAYRNKTHVITNGYDDPPRSLPTDTGHSLRILFAGEIYANRDPFPFLAAIDRLLARPEVHSDRVSVKFVGRCESFRGQSLADWMEGKRCRDVVEILPPVAPREVSELVGHASVLLNLAHRQTLQIPAKTYEQLVSGREILLLCEAHSDTARIVHGIPGVVQADPDNPAELDAALLDLYQRHAIDGESVAPGDEDVRRFSRNALNAQYVELLRLVVPSIA